MMNLNTNLPLPPIFCAIDTPDIDRALALAAAMQLAGCGIKLGLEFFNSHGPQGVRTITENYPDTPLFLDLKFHDIPNTCAAACRAAVHLGPAFINVHAGGGAEMMRTAADAVAEEADKTGIPAPRILGVTILTSLDETSLAACGFSEAPGKAALRLANLAQKAGLSGVVCSAHEIESVRTACGDAFILMVPGIRPAGSDMHDQKRIMAPRDALRLGATHLVIGRPITQAHDPAQAARQILWDIAS